GAIEDFTDVLDMEDEADWAYYNRGLAEASLEDYPAAIRDFTRVLKNDAKDGWALYQRGLARIHAGDHDEGCSDLRHAGDLGVEESESAIEAMCQ
ncbi:MAG TPA: tetratricopeptide repeat protein, partial [Bacteroidota bacterium]